MSRYTTADEEAIRTSTRVRDWKESGLVAAERAASMEQELRTALRRTNWALRVVLFAFAAFVVLAAVGLAFVMSRPDEDAVASGLALAAGGGSFFLADFLIARVRLYRFGIEEACAVCSIVLVSAGSTIGMEAAGLRDDKLPAVALLAAASSAVVVYRRFGLLYCAIAAGACAASAPFFLVDSETLARVLAVIVLLAIHLVANRLRRPFGDDYPGDDYSVLESAAWLGVYVALNLKLTPDFLGVRSTVPQAVYWATYVAIWILPIVGLYRGVRAKHHWMIRASLLMALGTIVTNKLYLGWPRHTWDPILLGLILVGIALAVRRWLSRGEGGRRWGFTSSRLLRSDERSVAQVALGSTALKHDDAAPETSGDDPFKTGGGRSGGAGAGARF